ncbi:MAG: phospholipid carrier-dependent glycosyltransferase, partial [Clostridia bacterium]|nr:phospholipid carrier-dependent glycosyltransferase [Clostridia bacterium]
LIERDTRTLALMLLLSCTVFINEGIVLDNSIRLGSEMGHLNSDTNTLARILSILNVMSVLTALMTCHGLCVEGKAGSALHTKFSSISSVPVLSAMPSFQSDPSLHWKRMDSILLAVLVAIYSVVTLSTLGSHKAPQHAWTSTGAEEQVVLDLGKRYEDFSMLYFCGVSFSDFSVAVSDDGEAWSDEYWAEMAQGMCYQWKYLMPCTTYEDTRHYQVSNSYSFVQKLSGRYVRITAQQIGLVLKEVIFRETIQQAGDGNMPEIRSGAQIPVRFVSQMNANRDSPLLSNGAWLVDEQDTLEGEPGWYNSTYFDEIYHARTAYEHLHGQATYETTHPPLGKVLMSWCIAIFGMTPFGWRFAGALAGILMLPAAYLLGKQLTKKTLMGFAAAAMMALDCMHFTQTRIATIDSFAVLFIMYSYLFMLRFMQRDIIASPDQSLHPHGIHALKSLLPDLALSGFFMGCAVASKWIGIYAGLGLALLFFWTCCRHLLRAGTSSDELKFAFRRIVIICIYCLLFFVMIPALIYLLSYIPYFAYRKPGSLGTLIKYIIQAQEGMLSYHSTPRLGMDHPFYSPWYEWPVIARPMYYAMAYYMPQGYSQAIFCFGNPAVWLSGLAGLFCVLLVWAQRHCYRLDDREGILHLRSRSYDVSPAFVLIGFMAQFLPWVLVPRGTYIYHYFASVPFLILSVILTLNWLTDYSPKIGKATVIVYLLICLLFFIILYPYASGCPTPYWWLDIGRRILRVYYS